MTARCGPGGPQAADVRDSLRTDLHARHGLWSTLWDALRYLGPRGRVAWLAWCCRQVSGRQGGVQVTEHTGTTDETVRDVMLLEYQYGLDIHRATEEAIRRARRQDQRGD
jgi:hypothetical protein